MPARPSRRTVVSAALAAPVSLVAGAATGCTLSGPPPKPASASRTPEVDPDVALLDEVIAGTRSVIALYEGVLTRHRDLRRDLRPLLTAHRAHAVALGEAAPGADRRPRGEPSNPGSRDIPAGRRAALRALRSAEQDTSAERLKNALAATSGGFARLLASMSACSAQHDRVLSELGAA